VSLNLEIVDLQFRLTMLIFGDELLGMSTWSVSDVHVSAGPSATKHSHHMLATLFYKNTVLSRGGQVTSLTTTTNLKIDESSRGIFPLNLKRKLHSKKETSRELAAWQQICILAPRTEYTAT
jgi:hypothetical protein